MPFEKGTSGNPKGRPSANVSANKLRKSINEDMPDILNKLIELAKGGDVQAIKLVLERVCMSCIEIPSRTDKPTCL